MNPYSSFLIPSELSLIIGRQDYEKRFETILSQFKADIFKQNLVIISGSPGIGKSSLLDLYCEIVKREMIVYIQPTIKMGKMNQLVLIQNVTSDDLKQIISDAIEDVTYNKLVINLANSINTLAGHNKKKM